MRKLVNMIEGVLQVVTIVAGIMAIIKMIQSHQHRKALKVKANEYLEDELYELEEVRRDVTVSSPTVQANDEICKKLLYITGVSSLALIIMHAYKED